MESSTPAPDQSPEQTSENTAWPWRLATTGIDYLPVFFIFIMSSIIFGRPGTGVVVEYYGDPPRPFYGVGETSGSVNLLVPVVLSSIICLINKGWLEGTTGQSVGKMLLGFRTQDLNTGEVLGPVRASVRWILLNVDIAVCLVGILWPIWDLRRPTLVSDRLTQSVVVPA